MRHKVSLGSIFVSLSAVLIFLGTARLCHAAKPSPPEWVGNQFQDLAGLRPSDDVSSASAMALGDEPVRVPLPPGATGSPLRTVIPQTGGIGRAVAIDAAAGHLYYSLYLTATPYIYKVDLNGVQLAQLLTLDCLGGPMAWDESTGTLWAMNYLNPSFGLYQLDPVTGNTIYSCDIQARNPGHPAVIGPLTIGVAPDGLDYDPTRDTLWASSEYTPPNWVVELDKNCTILSAFRPAIRGTDGSSGVAVEPNGLWLAYPTSRVLVQVDASGTPSGVEFLVGGTPEDLEYDPISFAPLCAVWVNEIANSRMVAYEIPCPPCGNGTVSGTEQCDDGNSDPGDLCAADCTFTTCGDAIVQAPNGQGTGGPLGNGVEQCDAGGATSLCTATCTLTSCGDGVIQTPNGNGTGGPVNDGVESCDDANSNPGDLCANDCTWTSCGDGVVQAPNGTGSGGPANDGVEACDDGGPSPRCNANCTLTTCGDGIVQAPNGTGSGGPANDGVEACDDGGPSPRCNANCTLTTCGDGVVQSPNGDGTGGATNVGDEQCDDGNQVPGDGCDRCVLESCFVGGIAPIRLLLAIKSTDWQSVVMTWRPDVSADRFNVWHVPVKVDIPRARQGGTGQNPSGCGPTGASSCWHFDAVPPLPTGPLHYYQVRGLCGTTEAAE